MSCHISSCSGLFQEMIKKIITEKRPSMAVSFVVIAEHICDRKSTT